MSDVAPRKLPVVIRRVEIKDGPYAGWHADMRVNPPQRVITGLMDNPEIEAIAALITQWNFVDEEGAPLDPRTQIGEIPPDLFKALWRLYLQEVWNPFWLK